MFGVLIFLLIQSSDRSCRLLRNGMQLARDRVRQCNAEWPSLSVQERQVPRSGAPRQLDGKPPLFVVESRRRREMPEMIPMLIPSLYLRSDPPTQ